MKILGLIPARGGSKGIPRKNIKLLNGKELIRYSIEFGLKCGFLDDLIVSTEDNEIAQIALAAGANVPFLRPSHLAVDASPSIDTIVHALKYFEGKNIFYDAVCLLQPTVPFRDVLDVNAAVEKFIQSNADSLISVREVPHVFNPHWIYELNKDGFLRMSKIGDSIIPRRQDLPKAFYRDGSIYLIKKEIILDQNSLFGNKTDHCILHNSPNINIDTIKDWEKAINFINDNLN